MYLVVTAARQEAWPMLLRRASTTLCDQSSGWTAGRLVAVCVIRDGENRAEVAGKSTIRELLQQSLGLGVLWCVFWE